MRQTGASSAVVLAWLVLLLHGCARSLSPDACLESPCDARPAGIADAGARIETPVDGGSASSDAGASSAADAAVLDASPATDAGGPSSDGLPALTDCTTEPQPAAPSYAPQMVIASLASLCEVLEAAGVACPVGRATYMASLDCEPGSSFPRFDRRCGVDHVVVGHDVGTVTWYFDAATGVLIGARVVTRAGQLPCGAVVYHGGSPPAACYTSDGSCRLCIGVPDACPADISASIPSAPCPAAAPEASPCSCGDGPEGVAFPSHGDACGAAGQCADCSSGTCWANCVCWRSGTLRYAVDCTE